MSNTQLLGSPLLANNIHSNVEGGELSFDFQAAVSTVAGVNQRDKSKMQQVSINLKRQSLIDQTRNKYRAAFCAIIGTKCDRVSDVVEEKIRSAVDDLLAVCFNKLESDDFEITNFTEAGYFNTKDETYKERRQMRAVRNLKAEQELAYSFINLRKAREYLAKMEQAVGIVYGAEQIAIAKKRLETLTRVHERIQSDIAILKKASESAS